MFDTDLRSFAFWKHSKRAFIYLSKDFLVFARFKRCMDKPEKPAGIAFFRNVAKTDIGRVSWPWYPVDRNLISNSQAASGPGAIAIQLIERTVSIWSAGSIIDSLNHFLQKCRTWEFFFFLFFFFPKRGPWLLLVRTVSLPSLLNFCYQINYPLTTAGVMKDDNCPFRRTLAQCKVSGWLRSFLGIVSGSNGATKPEALFS